MKTKTKHLRAITMTLVGGLALALTTAAHATIVGGVHDFSATAFNSSGQICKVCHIPHNGPGATEAPLFNHTVTASSFTPYASGTLDATLGQPFGVSKACLSCHDGTIALNAFGGNNNGVGGPDNSDNQTMGTFSPARNLGTDLSNDHPVSFTFDTALATLDGGLVDPSTLPAELRRFGPGRDEMHCATCHDVHQTRGTAATPGNKLLVVSLANSALCLTCHSK